MKIPHVVYAGQVGVAVEAERGAGAVDAVGESLKPHLDAVAVAVGGEDTDAAELKQGALLMENVAPVAVAPEDQKRDTGKLPRDLLRVPGPVAEKDRLRGAKAFHGAAHPVGAAVGIGEYGKQHHLSTFPVEMNIL